MCSTPQILAAGTCHEGFTKNMKLRLRIRPLLFVALLLGATSAHARDRLPPGFVYLHDVDPRIVQDIRYATDDNFKGRHLPGYDGGEYVVPLAAPDAPR